MKAGRILAIIGLIAVLYWLGLVPALLDLAGTLLDRLKGVNP